MMIMMSVLQSLFPLTLLLLPRVAVVEGFTPSSPLAAVATKIHSPMQQQQTQPMVLHQKQLERRRLQKSKKMKNHRDVVWLQLLGVDPVSLAIVGGAAMAGAMAQQPRIQQLERELKIVREALTASEQELVDRITELEEKLFEMDREYEGQTERFKKQYDKSMKEELERVTARVKAEYQRKLDMEIDRERSNKLTSQLGDVGQLTKKEEQLAQMRIRQQRMDDANKQLVRALDDSQKEVARMKEEIAKKSRRFFF